MEQRAYVACQSIKAGNLTQFAVTWSKSRTWGLCPRIEYRGEKAAHASGCGYDKLSAVLAMFLMWLDDREAGSVGGCGGAGVREVQTRLAAIGWKLTHSYDGKAEDGFEIEPCPIQQVKP